MRSTTQRQVETAPRSRTPTASATISISTSRSETSKRLAVHLEGRGRNEYDGPRLGCRQRKAHKVTLVDARAKAGRYP